MKIVISIFLAYLLSGITQVMKDLSGGVPDRPLWAIRPTLGNAIIVTTTWFTRPFMNNYYSCGQLPRAIAFGLLSVILQMGVLTGFIWCCITISAYLFHNIILQIILTVIILIITVLFILPLISFLMMPLTLLIAWPLDLLFPLKEKVNIQDIKWCRNCKHHKKTEEYEDIMNGLWRSSTMPRSDKIPCSIVLQTSDMWERYYKIEPSSRALFPNNCQFFEKRA